jgi:hypothetical protein
MFLPSQFLSKCNYQFANAAINLRYIFYVHKFSESVEKFNLAMAGT